ncbi:MAG: ATP-binding cassette domain-containing protein [Ignavibacteriae bacterium]|nr:ATP-binding cassette domain-containing protein [Ignavibacteriota bacterium]NOG98726.1 ATP-binding cassette domain-containing protein [Ignavibacteriota bacterium]
MLSINNLTKRFGKTLAINNISFNVDSGNIFGVLGPNGAGKSTILRSILNIIQPNSGEILIDSLPHNKFNSDKIGYLPEDRGLYQRSRVDDVLKYFGKLKSLSKSDVNNKIEFWSNKFELQHQLSKYVYELSKGNQQKVQFLISIIHDPDILILDEPFTGFDPINQKLILEIIKDFESRGKIILLSTHMLELAEKFCSEIILINEGEKIISGNLSEIKSNYNSSKYLVEFTGDTESLNSSEMIHELNFENGKLKLTAESTTRSSQLLNFLISKGEVSHFQKLEPSLTDIFFDSINKVKQTEQ